jgi:hypothetical protein
MTTRMVALLAAPLLVASALQAQGAPIGVHCAAALCEEGTMYAVAIDSLLRGHTPSETSPRVLRAVYVAPFYGGRWPRPAPVAWFDQLDPGMLRRYWPRAAIVDSADVVTPDGHTLTAGGPLYVVAPIDWTGKDDARVQIAEYPRDFLWGVQYLVNLRRGPLGWRVSQIDIGRQN